MRIRLTIFCLAVLFGLGASSGLRLRALWAQAEGWQQTAPGIEVVTLTRQRGNAKVRITAVRAVPARCDIRVVEGRGEGNRRGARAAEVLHGPGAAINASFFREDLTPIGLLVIDGKRLQPPLTTGGWSFFLVRNGAPALLKAGAKVPAGVTQGVQSRPRLVVDGKAVTFKQQPAAARSAVGVDAAGRLILAASDGPLTLEEWAACLRDDLGCRDALNLDGGSSTQLEVRGRVNRAVSGLRQVPTFITVTPREQAAKQAH